MAERKNRRNTLIKKFGLDQARILVSEPDAHLPTVKATLKILGVPNIVGQQVAKLVASAQKAIQTAIEAKNTLRVKDAEDEKVTTQTISNLRIARDAQAKTNVTAVAGHEKVVADHRQAVADLQALAKKFA